jgi:hydrogenase/urease accessory protein HupE
MRSLDSCAGRCGRRLVMLGLALVGMIGFGSLAAHPVAQGAMSVRVFPERIAIRATVSSEEVLIAAAYGREKNATYEQMRRDHQDYLLRHLRVLADGQIIEGHAIGAGEDLKGRVAYALEYPLPARAPRRIAVEQDVLREFEFAPGNRWEASYVVQVVDAARVVEEGLLTYREPLIFPFRAAPATTEGSIGSGATRATAAAFVRYGVMHILTGYDHLLFVAALLLAVATLWDLVKVITAFTLAHTITLALAALNILRLPDAIVEPMIAASIVFVAAQNVLSPERSRGWSRLLIAFGFGLFHGLGFAGGLLDAMTEMPAASALVMIAAFSLGVELGHQVVVVPAFLGLQLLRSQGAQQPRDTDSLQRFGSAAISCAGAVYLIAALRQAIG